MERAGVELVSDESEQDPESERKVYAEANRKAFADLWIERLDAKKFVANANKERQVSLKKRCEESGVAYVKPKPLKQAVVWDTGLKGLSLLVSAGGAKTFRSQFRLHGKWITRSIGRFGETVTDGGENANVAWAREVVRKDRALAKGDTDKGVPPVDPRRQADAPQRALKTAYEAVVDEFIEDWAKPQQRTWRATRAVLKCTCAPWLKRRFDSITKQEAKELIRGFVSEGKVYKARVTQAWVKTLWKWAYAEDYISANVMDALNIKFELRKRERVYSDDELKAIWKAANKLTRVEAAYIKVLILLAPRKTALARMRRQDLDDAKKPTLWTTPHELTKSKKSARKERVYLTPLPSLAQRIVKPLVPKDDADTDLIFPSLHSGIPIWPGSPLIKKLVKAGAPSDFTFHTMRHTVTMWLENQGHDEFDRGLVLNHAGSGVTSGYSHGYALDRKRDLLTKWCDHVERLVRAKGAVALLR